MSGFNALMNPAAIGQGITNSVYQGQEMARQGATQQAMAAYAQAPNQQNALMVASHDPRLGIQLGQYEQQRAAQAQEATIEARKAELRQKAASGNATPEEMAEMAGIDFQAFNAISDDQKAEIKKRADYIGNAALRISQLPEGPQRAAAWDAAVDQGIQLGYSDLAAFKGKYSPEALNAAVDQAGLVNNLIQNSRPSFLIVPKDADIVNQRDPVAVQRFAADRQSAPVRIETPEQARQLPPGTRFIDPNGVERVVPGGAGGNTSGNFPG